MNNSPKSSNPVSVTKTKSLYLLLSLMAFSCNLINEEWSDCLEECNGQGLMTWKYSGSDFTPHLHKEGTSEYNYQLMDTIPKEDFGLTLNFYLIEEAIRRPSRECCGYDYLETTDYIQSMELLVINLADQDTTIAGDFFRLINNGIADGPTLKEYSESGMNNRPGRLYLKLIEPDSIPVSSTFDLRITLSSGQKFHSWSRGNLQFKD